MELLPSVAVLERDRRRRERLVVVAALVASVAAGLLAGAIAVLGKPLLLGAGFAVLFPILAWRRLRWAVLCLLFLALAVEQNPVGAPGGDLTQQLRLFTSLNTAVGLSNVYVNSFEILLGALAAVVLVRAGERRAHWPGTALSSGLLVLLAFVLLGVGHGLVAGGDARMAIWEIRPTLYLLLGYLFVVQLPAELSTLIALLWTFVLAVALRALEGIWLVITVMLVHGQRPDSLLTHEDSLLFVLYVVLVAALWIFRQRGRMRTLATAILPLVLVVALANNRRTAWLQLGVCGLLMLVLAWVRLPRLRRGLAAALVITAVASGLYLRLYWHQTGLLAEPASAVKSLFAPDPRDASSDLYRTIENADLEFNIRMSPLIGRGYGVPIDYRIPIVDLSRIDPFIHYIPHNDVLYVWMRLGIGGALAFWSVIGLAVVAACRLLRAHDPRPALYGTVVVCALAAYLIQGALDLGFFWFRIAVLMGALLGGLELARRLPAEGTTDPAPSAPVPRPDAYGSGRALGGAETTDAPGGQVRPSAARSRTPSSSADSRLQS
jgi:hypothetical protein